jgi:hypothetical protein
MSDKEEHQLDSSIVLSALRWAINTGDYNRYFVCNITSKMGIQACIYNMNYSVRFSETKL